ncbi:hypothetical protein HELRODRAFT_178554 [Helobdella robusta]|uniref:Uncharacterized protein n=1 Tax=Helobdella robusta TaxID=6412 RepID=T1FDD2_HELRO|nr:hypothetical protein HELRODRAFT_178554 [Helobdella robusta]ESN97103.1 hypothetical protein HELRODRAFT_178554 [Helobdella robusta]
MAGIVASTLRRNKIIAKKVETKLQNLELTISANAGPLVNNNNTSDALAPENNKFSNVSSNINNTSSSTTSAAAAKVTKTSTTSTSKRGSFNDSPCAPIKSCTKNNKNSSSSSKLNSKITNLYVPPSPSSSSISSPSSSSPSSTNSEGVNEKSKFCPKKKQKKNLKRKKDTKYKLTEADDINVFPELEDDADNKQAGGGRNAGSEVASKLSTTTTSNNNNNNITNNKTLSCNGNICCRKTNFTDNYGCGGACGGICSRIGGGSDVIASGVGGNVSGAGVGVCSSDISSEAARELFCEDFWPACLSVLDDGRLSMESFEWRDGLVIKGAWSCFALTEFKCEGILAYHMHCVTISRFVVAQPNVFHYSFEGAEASVYIMLNNIIIDV